MVTAELAAALPALALLLVFAVWAVVVAAAQLRCADAAREAARAAARGEGVSVVHEVAREVAPGGAEVEIDELDGRVTVEVSATIALPGPIGDAFPAPTVRGRAVAIAEG